ncbi:MAG: Cupin 2 conserved barrel domain protein [Parcubacteria group bacterium]|nr:Cupin 2 conserved barrel domain protein [Parcubacteria group bacterium]
MNQESVFIPKSVIDATLATPAVEGKRQLDPLKALALAGGVPINILEDTNISNDVEVHRHEADLWICLEGEVEFIVGGTLVEPWVKQLADGGTDDRELKSKNLEGGTSHVLRVGDVLWIPAGEPHLHRTTGTARLYIIKVPSAELVPLTYVRGWK